MENKWMKLVAMCRHCGEEGKITGVQYQPVGRLLIVSSCKTLGCSQFEIRAELSPEQLQKLYDKAMEASKLPDPWSLCKDEN